MSNIVDYFTSGVTETYDETVKFWSGDDKLEKTINAVNFTYENPELMKEQFSKNIDTSIAEFNTAVNQDKNTFIVTVLALGTAYYFFTKGGK